MDELAKWLATLAHGERQRLLLRGTPRHFDDERVLTGRNIGQHVTTGSIGVQRGADLYRPAVGLRADEPHRRTADRP